jgi:ectoine hydroxylase-related dioxygenase (phytanoyl-CoA dioxygenase family)
MAADSNLKNGLTEEQRYRFDVQGYLVVEEVLPDTLVDELNAEIDSQELPEPSIETGGGRRFGDFLEWDESFCRLLDYEPIYSGLEEILGKGFRLDHYYGIYLQDGAESLSLHGGGTPYAPDEYYHHQGEQMFSGLTVVSWNLRDTGPNLGGFCCVPGSHKANYSCPDSIRESAAEADHPDELPDAIEVPSAPAGSMVIFTEALTHGTAPWRGSHNRRTLLYKYSPKFMSYASTYPELPKSTSLTDRQEHLFTPPHSHGRSGHDATE